MKGKKILVLCVFLLASCESKKIDSSIISINSFESISNNSSLVYQSSDDQDNSILVNSSEEIKKQKKNLILFVGDGMGNNHVASYSYLAKKNAAFLNFKSCQVDTNCLSKDFYPNLLTDSAASATAMATGELTSYRYVGKDKDGSDLTTIFDVAQKLNYKTGILTTDKLYGATPAGFSSHSLDRGNTDEIALGQALSGIDYLCGLTSTRYLTKYNQNFIDQGYAISSSESEMNQVIENDKVLLQYDLVGGGETLHFKDALDNALTFLTKDKDQPFILLAEQAHIDKESHSNNFEGMISNMKELDEGVSLALDFASKNPNTVIMVVADHETGSLDLSFEENSLYQEYIYPETNQKIYYHFGYTGHTNKTVGLYTYGYDVDYSKYNFYFNPSIVKNTNVYDIMYDVITEN